jgi:hypothetical protein
MKHSQRPYTVYDPFHASEYYTLKRAAFCVGCLHNDEFLEDGQKLEAGTKVVKVSIGNGPSTRTQHFHPECYASHVNHVMTAVTASNFKVYPARDSGMAILPHDGEKCLYNQIKSAIRDDDDDGFWTQEL